jgi:cell pole-organizing protein PopZ
MGDISAEPSMEDILSSIKRIIAEEGESATAASRVRRAPPPRPMTPRADPTSFGHEEILELSDPVRSFDEETPLPVEKPAMPAEPILSPRAAEASRGSLDALSRMIVKPDVAGSDTLESLVREMLRPMLRDWLDTNLPAMVETMVAREISRITGSR